MANFKTLSKKARERKNDDNQQQSGLAADVRVFPLYITDRGVRTNWVGVRHPNGFYRMRTVSGRAGARLQAEASKKPGEGVPAETNAVGTVYQRSSRSGDKIKVGQMRSWNNQKPDTSATVFDEELGDYRPRRFDPILLVLENDRGGESSYQLSQFGENVITAIIDAEEESDDETLDKLYAFLHGAYAPDFDGEGRELEGTTSQGIEFVLALEESYKSLINGTIGGTREPQNEEEEATFDADEVYG